MTENTRVRRFDRSTSWEAALRQTPEKRAALYSRIRHTLAVPTVAGNGLTDEELLAKVRESVIGATPSGVRSRRAELVEAGWVTELRDERGNVVKRPTASGSPATVWRGVLEGEDFTPPPPRPVKAEGVALDVQPDDAGLAAARRFAGWEIGDPYWANRIIEAYLHPEETNATLDADGVPAKTGTFR